jgi:hypothetical protein
MPGTWTPLVNQPAFNASTMLLLTDGTVMCQNSDAHDWYRLTPDANGSYVNGTWSALASTTHAPLYYASAVLRDGRVFRAGGEYDAGVQIDLNVVEIYDPVANVWNPIAAPPGVTIGDAISCVLPNGTLVMGNLGGAPAVYDPVANTWSPTGPKSNGLSDEESWTLLPQGTVFTLDCFGHPHAEKYVPATNTWISAGDSPVDLVFDVPKEIGPALLLPNGHVFCVGGNGNTVLYDQGATATSPGTFSLGPTMPQMGGFQLGAMDAPGALLPNGLVLFAVGPVDNSGTYRPPTYLFEYDPASNTATQVLPGPANLDKKPYWSRMLLLPTGQVLFANSSTYVSVYTPTGGPQAAWRPTITSCPATLQASHTYTLQGRQFNGLSQACAYGDDAQMATNYPIVRLEYPGGHVVYCRTANHSTMAVATGAAIVSTQFSVPPSAPNGSANLVVVANGIPSAPFAVHVGLIKKIEKLEKIEKFEKVEKIEHKEIKELKNEKIEHLEKIPKEIGEKGIVENQKLDEQQKFAEVQNLGQQDLQQKVQQLSQQVTQLGAAVQQHQAFIDQAERPSVGEPPAEQEDLPPRHREH